MKDTRPISFLVTLTVPECYAALPTASRLRQHLTLSVVQDIEAPELPAWWDRSSIRIDIRPEGEGRGE